MTDLAWIALSLTGRIGLRTMRALLAQFGSTDAVLAADEKALRQVPGVGKVIASSIRQINLRQVEALIQRWHKAGVRVLLPAEYPSALREVEDAPPVLYVRGGLSEIRGAAVVGTREPTPAAVETAKRLAGTLVEKDYTVVSGLALGIDTAAHQSALDSSGVSVAVLGSGVLNIYPNENRSLALRVAWAGALISEVHPDAQPSSSALVARNRIISGLCERVFVVESDDDGGAMHAARFARTQGRALHVWRSNASGNRVLLESGAIPFDADWYES